MQPRRPRVSVESYLEGPVIHLFGHKPEDGPPLFFTQGRDQLSRLAVVG